jgi:hypothetical protein
VFGVMKGGARKLDDYTVEFHLEAPDGQGIIADGPCPVLLAQGTS